MAGTDYSIKAKRADCKERYGRRLAAIDARLAWVPVEYQEYATEAEEYADLLADNRIAELAEMDNDKLSEILKDLQETENFDMDLTGFDEDALADLIVSS
ncbi:MAG: hypothetical protein ACLU45_01945 [Dialister invisus]|uniref:hypothetical protein n=1 Tax=Dialister invisus TaxID=218538 RepID=UPI00399A1DC8